MFFITELGMETFLERAFDNNEGRIKLEDSFLGEFRTVEQLVKHLVCYVCWGTNPKELHSDPMELRSLYLQIFLKGSKIDLVNIGLGLFLSESSLKRYKTDLKKFKDLLEIDYNLEEYDNMYELIKNYRPNTYLKLIMLCKAFIDFKRGNLFDPKDKLEIGSVLYDEFGSEYVVTDKNDYVFDFYRTGVIINEPKLFKSYLEKKETNGFDIIQPDYSIRMSLKGINIVPFTYYLTKKSAFCHKKGKEVRAYKIFNKDQF